jgi:hypothetical protein
MTSSKCDDAADTATQPAIDDKSRKMSRKKTDPRERKKGGQSTVLESEILLRKLANHTMKEER